MDIKFERTSVESVYLVRTPIHDDNRGHLQEIHETGVFSEWKPGPLFKRSFYSRSREDVLRGLHVQQPPYRQSKLISCLSGEIFDVAVDLRPGSETYGQTVTVRLSGTGEVSLLVPRGFAHGFVSLADATLVHYLSDNSYAPDHESGVHWASEALDIDWPVNRPTVSAKDRALPSFSEYTANQGATDESDRNVSSVPPSFEGDTGYRVLYAKARYGDRERDRVNDVLDNPAALVRGEYTEEFESRVAALFGKEHGVMVNSGSSANLLAMDLLDLPPGSKVLTPMLTFSTTVAPLAQLDLVPRFVDVRRSDFQINVQRLEDAITPDTEAILVPSLVGLLPNYQRLSEIASAYDLKLIEDSADTIGAAWEGRKTGTYTDLTTTSFYASHIVTGFGGGGMVCMDDDTLYERALKLRGWGRRAEASPSTNPESRFDVKIGGVTYDEKFVFDELGYNFLPLEASAAFGTAQLDRLPEFTERRRQNFRQLHDIFDALDGLTPSTIRDEAETCPLAFPVTVQPEAPFDKQELVVELENNGIQTRSLWSGVIVEHPGFEDIKCELPDDPYDGALHAMRNSLVVGCHQNLDMADIEYIEGTVTRFVDAYD